MRKHSVSTLSSVKRDRKKGYTISQLMGKYSLPKTTVWHYIQGVTPTKTGAALIRSSRGGNSTRRDLRWASARNQANTLLQDMDEKKTWPILLLALYWTEGTKKSFVFTNTDESMIRIYLKLLRVYLGVTNQEIQVLVRICSPMNPSICRSHWGRVTRIPITNIKVNKHNSYNKSTTKYGMCRITVRKGGNHLKLVHCLIETLTDKMLQQGPRSSTD